MEGALTTFYYAADMHDFHNLTWKYFEIFLLCSEVYSL